MDADAKYQAILKAYEDGKHRRYELLFAVNGGAFAVATLSHEKLENLGLTEVAVGLIIFTVVMEFDIAAFGYAMRKRVGDSTLNAWEGVFSRIGQGVLWALCLIIVGWLLVWKVGKVVPGFDWTLWGGVVVAVFLAFAPIWRRFHPS
jgi:hypothetical protein